MRRLSVLLAAAGALLAADAQFFHFNMGGPSANVDRNVTGTARYTMIAFPSSASEPTRKEEVSTRSSSPTVTPVCATMASGLRDEVFTGMT